MFGVKILEERKSKFNGVLRVVRSFGLGTYIQAEGLTQSGGVVETFWKQTLRKVKGKRLEVKDVLILGLGGGTVAKLVNKMWPETKITGVDIDSEIVELGKKYLGLGKIKVDIKIKDAIKMVPGRFDLIIIDLYNGDQFPKKFANKNFLQFVKKKLSKSGVAVFNRLYYRDKKFEAEKFGKMLENSFNYVEEFRPVSNIMYICNS